MSIKQTHEFLEEPPVDRLKILALMLVLLGRKVEELKKLQDEAADKAADPKRQVAAAAWKDLVGRMVAGDREGSDALGPGTITVKDGVWQYLQLPGRRQMAQVKITYHPSIKVCDIEVDGQHTSRDIAELGSTPWASLLTQVLLAGYQLSNFGPETPDSFKAAPLSPEDQARLDKLTEGSTFYS